MGKDQISTLSFIVESKGSRPHLPGEAIQGEVHLCFPALVEEKFEKVAVTLSGFIDTKIIRGQGQFDQTGSDSRQQRVNLVQSVIQLWRKGEAYPPEGSRTLVLPFRFHLPASLPPSCSLRSMEWTAAIEYALQVSGERCGPHSNRAIRQIIPVLPADAEGAVLQSVITAKGWQGVWNMRERQTEIRRGMWGAYSQVKAMLFVPDLPAFPTETPIPFHLKVVTISKPMRRDAVKEGESIFPTPPMDPKGLDFWLNRVVWLRADNWTRRGTYPEAAKLGNLGERSHAGPHANLEIEPMDKVWIPLEGVSPNERKQEGQWKQEVTIKSRFTLSQTPSFETDILKVKIVCRRNEDQLPWRWERS
ncbi:hypothetical protein PHLGIDRAFT_178532 [Phlebiopsis gigantea 11061_1 CR5-6]|uniref:Arrestin-like N-terminal domain-containing protein n=1 Tax=Phlebiopsis gigantea (strain 11061_1 CR5-6) TaxID=745531 RepID=A0A0C3RUU0_PHLG1|nr:hypothetical protein PHLGIDRAFT_178532 [Phlebiopsis gigantea 11061_1 CR5-6]